MNLRSGNQLRSTRPVVENLEDRCVLSLFGVLSGLTQNNALLAPLTNPGSTASTLSTPATSLSNINTTVTSVLANVLDTVANPNLTSGNTLTGITSAVTTNLASLAGSPSTAGSLAAIVNNLNALTGVVTSLTGLVGTNTSGGLNLQVGLNSGTGGLNLGGLLGSISGLTNGLLSTVGGLTNGLLNTVGGLTNNLLGGVVGNLLGGVLNDLTSLTASLVGIGQGLTSSVTTEIVGNLVGPGTHISVQVQTPVVSTSIIVSTETQLPPVLPPVVGANPLLPPSNLLRTDSHSVGGSGAGSSTELFAGGPTAPNPATLPAGEALAAAQNRPQFPKENATAVTEPVAGPVVRGLFGFVPEVQPMDPDAAGVALIVPAAPAGADGGKGDTGGAEGGRGMAVTDTPQVAAGLDAAPQSESPQYSNVLADCSPFGLAAAEAALARFMNQVKEVTSEVGAFIVSPSVYPWMLAAVAATGAFEYRRRTRRGPQGLASTLAGEETVLPWLVDAEGPLSCKPN